MKFNEYNFNPFICKTLESIKITQPTAVQEKVIPILLQNKNVLVQSHTGTGKTLAYLLPILNNIDINLNLIQAIILVPTRELALQVIKILQIFVKNNNKLHVKKIIGGNLDINNNFKQPHIIVGTPTKIRNLFDLGKIKLNHLKYIVFDELDMIYELKFLEEINYLLSKIKSNEKFCFSGFSATIFKEIEFFFNRNIPDFEFVNLVNSTNKVNKNIEHIIIPTKHRNVEEVILKLLASFSPYICMIFINKKNDINQIFNLLKENKYKVCMIHGDMQTRERNQILKKIRNLEYTYVVCSDILSRGIDIDGVSHVISLDFPVDLNYYIHRSGRTGRNNYKGYSYVLSDYDNVNKVEELKKWGINFKNFHLENNQFVEKNILIPKRIKQKDKSNDYKKRMLLSKFEKVKPGYKNKRKKALSKLKK